MSRPPTPSAARPTPWIDVDDPWYPRRLRGTRGAPPTLHVRGILRDPDRAIAIVGARAATSAAMARAFELARTWAARGDQIVSGGAIGVDGAAHRGALAAGGSTVVVLGSGCDVPYPRRHAALFDQIAAGPGAVVSPFADGTPPRGGHFVRRDAIIAGLADAVVVVAAAARSGSLHTAGAAAALGRPVLAVPGTPGCDRLLAAGAAPLEAPDDLDRVLAGEPRVARAPSIDPGGDAARALAALDGKTPRDADDVAASTGIGAARAAALLFELELEGLAIALPGRYYVRSNLAAQAC